VRVISHGSQSETVLSNDAAHHRLTDVLGLLQNQVADIAAVREKQAALELTGQAADGTVEVTVNARGQLVKTVIDKSFLDDHDFDDLGDFVTKAAQAAAKDAAGRVAEMLAPINERHAKFPSLSEVVEGMPDPRDLMPPGLDAFISSVGRRDGSSVASAGGRYDDGPANQDEGDYPTVRR
jgi:DNA-binding protein YbaB